MLHNNQNQYKAKEQLSEKDFRIYKDAYTVPFTRHPSYLPTGFLGICTRGSIEVRLYTRKHVIRTNDLIVFLPGFLVSQVNSSPTFSINYCTFSVDLFYRVMNGSIKRFPIAFYTYMKDHFQHPLSETSASDFSFFFDILYNRASSATYLFPKESVINLLKIPFIELYSDYCNTAVQTRPTTVHKEEIGYFFFALLLEHYKENKEVSFYAEKLHVTSKYLTEALTQVSGKSPKEWIIQYTLQEIEALLATPSVTLQEIVSRTRFTNQTTLRRFFQRHMGISLSQYRKNS